MLALSQRPLQDRSDAFAGPPRPACTFGPDSTRSLLRDSRSSSRCSRAAARLWLEVRRVVQNEPSCPTNTPSSAPKTPNSPAVTTAVSYTHLRAHETPEHLV